MYLSSCRQYPAPATALTSHLLSLPPLPSISTSRWWWFLWLPAFWWIPTSSSTVSSKHIKKVTYQHSQRIYGCSVQHFPMLRGLVPRWRTHFLWFVCLCILPRGNFFSLLLDRVLGGSLLWWDMRTRGLTTLKAPVRRTIVWLAGEKGRIWIHEKKC